MLCEGKCGTKQLVTGVDPPSCFWYSSSALMATVCLWKLGFALRLAPVIAPSKSSFSIGVLSHNALFAGRSSVLVLSTFSYV